MNSKINILSRREFLARNTQLAAVAALSALTGIPSVVQRALAEGSIGQPGPNGRPRKVLFVFLRGANDGLNALIPVSDPAYLASRDTIGIRNNPDSAWNYHSTGSALWTPSGANAAFGINRSLTREDFERRAAGV